MTGNQQHGLASTPCTATRAPGLGKLLTTARGAGAWSTEGHGVCKEGQAYTGLNQRRIRSEQDRANAWVKVGHAQEDLSLARSYSLHLSDFRGYEGTGLIAEKGWRRETNP